VISRRAFVAAAAAPLPDRQRLTVTLGPEREIERRLPWPYLTQLRDGTSILFGHRGWPAGGRYPIHYTGISRDQRATFTEWKHEPRRGRGPITEGAAVELRDGRLLVFDVHAEHTGGKRFEASYWITRDSFRTLDGPFQYSLTVPGAEVNGFDDRGEPISRLYLRRSILELPNGHLIACAYGRFEDDKAPVEYMGKMTKMRSFLVRSQDHGKTWSYTATISADPVEQEGSAEPALVRLTQGSHPGRLLCVLRTGRENPIYQCESDDEGRTWTRAYPLKHRYSRFGRERDIAGADPDIVEMRDGTLALAYGHKPDYEDHGNFLAFSLDHGRTWSEVVRISSSVTMAYCGVREVAPGELFVVYTVSNLVQSTGYRDAAFTTVGRHVRLTRPSP